MRHFFRVYLSVADDLAILFKGSIYRKYHKGEITRLYQEKYESIAGDGSVCMHDRGRDASKIYKTAEDKFMRCSIDGFDYEYCALKKRKYPSKFDDVSYCVLHYFNGRTSIQFIAILFYPLFYLYRI